MTMRGDGLKPNTIHLLGNGGLKRPFEWTGKGWSTPGTGYGSKPGTMIALGWSYLQEQPSKGSGDA